MSQRQRGKAGSLFSCLFCYIGEMAHGFSQRDEGYFSAVSLHFLQGAVMHMPVCCV